MNRISTELAFQGLKDIAVNHKVKYILTVNEIWPLLLGKHNVPLTHYRFKVYQFNENSLPILLCKSNGNVKILSNKLAVEIARSLLGLYNSSIPLNTEYEIKVYK